MIIDKWNRSRIFHDILQLAAGLPGALCFNVCLDTPNHEDPHMVAWDRLINRIERTMLEFERKELPLRRELITKASNSLSAKEIEQLERRLNAYASRAIIVSDEGREQDITKALRRMSVFNPIPSQFGTWNTGRTKNIAAQRIIEDPIFKRSFRSYFIQLVDCIAFSLLKREVPPTPNVQRYSIHKMFDSALPGICYRPASPRDPLGIVRA
jgi:hypothetical protein